MTLLCGNIYNQCCLILVDPAITIKETYVQRKLSTEYLSMHCSIYIGQFGFLCVGTRHMHESQLEWDNFYIEHATYIYMNY